jgi:hypothetical protein
MNPTQPPLPLTLANGEPLEDRPGEEYRKHTAERWRDPVRGDPASYEYCLYLIRSLGIVTTRILKEEVDKHREARGIGSISKQSIQALKNDKKEFKPGELNDIMRHTAELLALESMGASRELVDKVTSTKDLGPLAMMMTSAHNIKQIQSGGPTEIKAVHHRFSVDDFEKVKAAAQGKVIEVETLKTPPLLPEAVLETILTPLTPVKAEA